ncbi:hypothetical protein [uncultured Chryseobacterium sp.]|uniref:hypothetical protein n=1 Tax=uncultured Chryseobacterium sp. TaxID=259322 RepID=UPI0025FCB87E|nr:hypothetical protein [uncultured Chryseobacterium sp.]
MQKYPYHSPVRFYPTKEALEDMTNPQNAQFFGSKNPYPLEQGIFHRYLIPVYENDVDTTDLELWLVGENEIQIACSFGFNSDQNRLLSLTFGTNDSIQGAFEIRKATGETVFYSNCVEFLNSTTDGRQYVQIATKCYFNKLGYDFENTEHDWFVTNLPAYDLGLFLIDSEYTSTRNGDLQSLEIQDSWLDEVSTLEFIGKGDCNVMNFILFSISNNEFYLNGTKRTIKEKPEVDDFMIKGKMKFAHNKDKTGKYIVLDEDAIFSDILKPVLGNPELRIVYTYENNNVIPIK